MISEELRSQLNWQQPPLNWLSSEQQEQVETQAQSRQFKLGEVIWDTDKTGYQFLILSGNVRLIPDEGSPILLKQGDWFGTLPQLSDRWKARGASKEAVVLEWPAQVWTDMLGGDRIGGDRQSRQSIARCRSEAL